MKPYSHLNFIFVSFGALSWLVLLRLNQNGVISSVKRLRKEYHMIICIVCEIIDSQLGVIQEKYSVPMISIANPIQSTGMPEFKASSSTPQPQNKPSSKSLTSLEIMTLAFGLFMALMAVVSLWQTWRYHRPKKLRGLNIGSEK